MHAPQNNKHPLGRVPSAVSRRRSSLCFHKCRVSHLRAHRFRVSRGNAWDPGAWGGGPVWDHTYVLMMEVLDNLPHDR